MFNLDSSLPTNISLVRSRAR